MYVIDIFNNMICYSIKRRKSQIKFIYDLHCDFHSRVNDPSMLISTFYTYFTSHLEYYTFQFLYITLSVRLFDRVS